MYARLRDIGGGVFDDGREGYREEFLYAVEMARALHDPAEDWEGFRDALWANLTRVFGIDATDVAGPSLASEADASAGADVGQRDEGVGHRSAATPRT
jgi:hypothetical protein